MKAVQRMLSAWHRFFFVPGCTIRTVIALAWRPAGPYPAARS